jgi:hypothetical protein
MSTKLLDDSNLDLLNPNLTQASQYALAFCPTVGVHALGAARARVLHVCAPEPPRRASGPCSLAESRPPSSTHRSPPSQPLEPYSAAVRSAMAASGRPQPPLPRTAPPEPLALASSPLSSPSSSPRPDRPRQPSPHAPGYRMAVADDPIHGHRGTDLAAL